ncbi:hypothetical protein SAMN04488012_11360 [Palleronia salina]|uniref:Uncharacterized protein n=1 Tax=Palleronia salina TaxID=313368 RepID=A0A1M6KX89_9RHOB|nr:hypothetical protein [Palleronia salina]SHJ63565.1 hypothetical protein SAMN04488012_11360 [Palleronia salina]
MSANTRTALAIVAAVAFVVSMFLGALTTPMVPAALSGLLANIQTGDAQSIAILGVLLAVIAVALLQVRRGWAQVVLAVIAGLALGSLAPPVMAGSAP